MSWMTQKVSHTEPGTHPMLNQRDEDSSNALAVMEKAGALFNVYYPPAGHALGADPYGAGVVPLVGSGKHEGHPLYKWVVRADTNETLGLHSGSYAQTDSYKYVGEMAERLFPNSTESCTLFGKGERMALAQNIGEPIDLGDGDIIKPQVMWVSSYNGQWSTAVYHLTHRWFCMNQLAGASPIFSVKHTTNHNFTFEQRSNILLEAMEHAQVVARMARTLKDQAFTDAQFEHLVKQVVPLPKAFNDDGDIHAIAERRMKQNRDAMQLTWRTECVEFGTVRKHVAAGSEQVEVFDGNRWLAYNAVQGAEQHNINARFNTSDVGKQRSMTKMISGGTPFASRALDLLRVG
jgi:hypothetical protein